MQPLQGGCCPALPKDDNRIARFDDDVSDTRYPQDHQQ